MIMKTKYKLIVALSLSLNLLASPTTDEKKTILYGINYLNEVATKRVIDIVKNDSRFAEARFVVLFTDYSNSGMHCIIFSGKAKLDMLIRQVLSKVDVEAEIDDLPELVQSILVSSM